MYLSRRPSSFRCSWVRLQLKYACTLVHILLVSEVQRALSESMIAYLSRVSERLEDVECLRKILKPKSVTRSIYMTRLEVQTLPAGLHDRSPACYVVPIISPAPHWNIAQYFAHASTLMARGLNFLLMISMLSWWSIRYIPLIVRWVIFGRICFEWYFA